MERQSTSNASGFLGFPRATGRASAGDRGTRGEDLAERWLRKKLRAEILERNFHCPLGEIDLIARKGEVLLFVEVKTRKSLEAGLPEEAITEEKKERLRKCALLYLTQRGYNPETTLFRFDVIAVYLNSRKPCIRHYPSAF